MKEESGLRSTALGWIDCSEEEVPKQERGNLTEISKERAEAAIWLFSKGKTKWIIVSGGATGPLNVSEARALSAYLQSLGVPREIILEEEYSKTTIGNAYYTKNSYLSLGGS